MDRYRAKPGATVRLAEWDPGETSAFAGSKEQAPAELDRLRERLVALQETLWAERKRRVLVVLQAMNTGGKDGVIRHVLSGVNLVVSSTLVRMLEGMDLRIPEIDFHPGTVTIP